MGGFASNLSHMLWAQNSDVIQSLLVNTKKVGNIIKLQGLPKAI